MLGPLVNQDGLILFMSTIGVTFVLEGISQMIFGAEIYPLKLLSDRCLVFVRKVSSPAAFCSTSWTSGAA